MAENTTTTTTTKDDANTTTTTTTEAQNGPSREDSLNAAAQASPQAERQGETPIDSGAETKVLGEEGQSSEDRLDDARRDALQNSQGEQDLHA